MRAFSLVELMVVIAIVALLATTAGVSYRSYMVHARISATMSYLESVRSNIEHFYTYNGRFPTNATEAQYDHDITDDSSVDSIAFYGCDQANTHSFVINLTPLAAGGVSGAQLVFVVTTNNGVFQWYCRQGGSPLLDMKYVPAECTNSTSLDAICSTSNSPTIVE